MCEEEKGPLRCACLQRILSPTPTCHSHREQDTLTLICTSGDCKPQPRQQSVHRGRVGGGAMVQGAQVYANMRV